MTSKKKKKKILNFIIFLGIGILATRRLLTMQNPSYQMYGVYDLNHIKSIARETAEKYPYGANKENLYKMLLETAIVETDAGQAIDKTEYSGRSIMQFDKIGYEEALRIRNIKGSRVYQKEVEAGYMSSTLQRNPRFAMYLARFFYLGKSKPIPSTLEERANYWKIHYNSIYGAGSPEKYISLVKKHLGKDWK